MSHYFTNDRVESNEKIITVKINDEVFKFVVDNGVFSKKGLDFGTRTLLESIDTNIINGDVLDFGCGYGPVGIYVSKKTNSKVDMVDINERALNLSLKNAKLNNVTVNVYKSDVFSNIIKTYDYIITNPPIRVGKKILYEIIFQSLAHLKKNGKLFLVINKNQGAKTLLKDLNEKYLANVIEKNKGFYVIEAQNR